MFHWHFTQMWLFILAGMLQTALIVERILNRILSFFFALSISEVQKLALGNLFIALLIFTLKLIFFPFALLLRILKAMWSNAILALFVLCDCRTVCAGGNIRGVDGGFSQCLQFGDRRHYPKWLHTTSCLVASCSRNGRESMEYDCLDTIKTVFLCHAAEYKIQTW